jgi:hypothetical protein
MRPMMRTIQTVLISLVVCGFLHACAAHSGETGRAMGRATLVVTNLHQVPIEISIDGWRIGTVPPTSRETFGNIRPGQHLVSAVGPEQHVTKSFQFKSNVTRQWYLQGTLDNTKTHPQFGAVQFINNSDYDVLVEQHGIQIRVLAGDHRLVKDVLAVPHQALVSVPGTRYEKHLSITPKPNATIDVSLSLETGTLALVNATHEPIQLFVDGRLKGTCLHKETLDVPNLLVGTHRLLAQGTHTGRKYRRQVGFTEGETIGWDLNAATGNIRIQNLTEEPVSVSIGEIPRGIVEPRGTLTVNDARLGERVLTATGEKSKHRWSSTLSVVAGHELVWRIRDNAATLIVDNRRSEEVTIYAGGAALRTVKGLHTTHISNLNADLQEVEVLGGVSRDLTKYSVSLSPARSFRLTVDRPEALLRVSNQTTETMMVYLAAKPMGRVPASSDLIFTQAPIGTQRIEARGVRTGNVIRGTLSLAEATTTLWNVRQETGTLIIQNESNETLLLPPTLQHTSKALIKGAKDVFTLPVGARAIKLVGADTGQSYAMRFMVTQGKSQTWEVPRLEGIVQVYNRTQETQLVSFSGGDVRTLPSGQHLAQRMPVGRHTLVAEATGTKEVTEATILVRPNASYPFEISPKLSKLRILNETTETLDLRINGDYLGAVGASDTRLYAGLTPGSYRVEAQGRTSGAIQEATLTLAPSRLETWSIYSAEGAALILNQRNEPVRVELDGKALGLVDSGKARRLEVGVGRHLIELIGLETKAHFHHRVFIYHDRTLSIQAPRGPAAISIVNDLDTGLSITLGDRTLGSVPAGSTKLFLVHEMGQLNFIATSTDGQSTFHRRISFQQDQTQQWHLKPQITP